MAKYKVLKRFFGTEEDRYISPEDGEVEFTNKRAKEIETKAKGYIELVEKVADKKKVKETKEGE